MYNVAVVGCGVVGLPTALAVQQELGSKVKVTIFTEELSPNTTGDVAAGLWTPYLLGDTPEEKITEWAKATQDYILKLWKQGKAKETGISLQLMMAITDDPKFEIPNWAKIALAHSELSQQLLQKYSRQFNANFTGGFSYVSFVWEASKFLPYLQQEFLTNGGDIKVAYIKNFEELADFDVIVNCSGINSRTLVPDLLVHPIRGQIARVEAPWQFHTFFADVGNQGYYIIPNHEYLILGGTHQEGDYSLSVSEDDAKIILDGCSRYRRALKTAPVFRHQVGLRPGRREIRVEFERRKIGNADLKIVHNYGHGGSGVTLSIGCAQSAAKLVRVALEGSRSKL